LDEAKIIYLSHFINLNLTNTMKKILLSCAVVCAAVIGSTNQTYAQNHIGIKAGVSLMNLGAATSNGISINYQYRSGLQIGVFGEENLSEKVTLSPQLLYTQKGGNVQTTISGIEFVGYTQINYIDLPVLFGFKLQPKLTFLVGPQASFLMSQKTLITATGAGSNTNTETEGLRRVLLGGNLGLAYNLTKHVSINANYIFDFNNVADGKSTPDTGERNSGFVFTVGYLF
jgi:hypothetical protein